eukprot:scaffold80027_cov35-Tisochrysis_lutea.AAC.2
MPPMRTTADSRVPSSRSPRQPITCSSAWQSASPAAAAPPADSKLPATGRRSSRRACQRSGMGSPSQPLTTRRAVATSCHPR